MAEEACQSGAADAEMLDTLAIAYAATAQADLKAAQTVGDGVEALGLVVAAYAKFDKAVAAAKQALERASAAGQADLEKGIEKRLRLYERRKPFTRETARAG